MQQGMVKYHETEWKRQIQTCKHNAIEVLQLLSAKRNDGSVKDGNRLLNRQTGSIIVGWGPSRWNVGRVQVMILWHPNPALTWDEFYNSHSPDGTIEDVKVLSKPLTDSDMEMVGWGYFDGWRDDEWTPVGPPDDRADR